MSEAEKTEDSVVEEKDNLENFGEKSLEDMEQSLRDEQEKLDTEAADTEDSAVQESESEEEVEETEGSTGEEESAESETEEKSEVDDKQDQGSTMEDRLAKVEKSYKELQADYTRKAQELAELKRLSEASVKEESPEKKPTKLDQLREKSPEAAALFEEMKAELAESLKQEIQPIEEQFTLRTRQQNTASWEEQSSEFLKSDLAELEPQLVSIYNENPDGWQRLILESPDAFGEIKKELVSRHWDQVKEVLAKKSVTKKTEVGNSKKKEIAKANVGKKSKTSPNPDLGDVKDFSNLSLAEMEKRLPKAEE